MESGKFNVEVLRSYFDSLLRSASLLAGFSTIGLIMCIILTKNRPLYYLIVIFLFISAVLFVYSLRSIYDVLWDISRVKIEGREPNEEECRRINDVRERVTGLIKYGLESLLVSIALLLIVALL
ncbi:MAG: hypothetical protein DRJ32_05230 [Thermoprotei archaeon]|nr:MAG: hypothetical protein DRJ32_05230 [Thermoprotei archaeon]HDD63845.1 hypothetical protein [Thermoprotei archaeon]